MKLWILCFLSALLCAIPMTFPSLGLLSFVSFAPFFLALMLAEKRSFRFYTLFGFVFGFCYHALIYFWFLWLYPLSFAGLSDLASLGVVLLAWLGISLFHGALYVLPALLYRLTAFSRGKALPLFSAIFGVLVAQWIPSLSQLAFPWVRLSLGLYRMPQMIQLSSVFGAAGVDLLLLVISAFLAHALASEKKKRMLSFVLALALFGLNLSFGTLSLLSEKEGEPLTVSLIQGNLLSGEKWSGDSALATYTEMTETVEGSDLVVWPESAVPVNLAQAPKLLPYFQTLSDRIDTPIFLGCFWEKDGQTTNSALYLDGESVSEVYSKRHLVPFGERVPYRALLSRVLPVLTKINLLSEDLAAGTDPVVMETPLGDLGGIICFESLFPALSRETVAEGASLLLLVTNDSWYEDSPGVWQHLAHSVFRSVENGRSTARCANSGVSAIIDAKGRITAELGPLQKGVLTGEVTLHDHKTVYQTVGDVLLPLCAALWLILTVVERRRRHG